MNYTQDKPNISFENSVSVLFITLSFASLLLILLVRFVHSYGQRSALYPPGPPTLPIIGNAHIFPRSHIEKAFLSWARKYGDVFSLKVMNQTIIVLNTPSLMKTVFIKNNASNTNRPASTIADIIAPNNLNFGTARFANDTWKVMRKASQLLLTARNFRPFHGVLHAESTQMVMNLMTEPVSFMDHCERFTTSFLLAIMYGARGSQQSSPDVQDFLFVNHRFMAALDILAALPVDVFPVLKYVPRRFAGWKREAEAIHELQGSLYLRLLQKVKARLARGEGNGCFMEQAIANADEWGLKDDDWLSNLGGTLLEGSHTTSGVIQTLIVSAVAHADKQALVAKEIEKVIGHERVPRLEDIDSLPYTRAFIKETQRLYPVAPIGLPHEMTEDVIIDGHLYPKDAVVFMNTYYMYRDERYFERPEEFLPERFLDNVHRTRRGVLDDPDRNENLLFGGGKRMCPGLTIAKTTVDMISPYILWAFEFSPVRDPVTGLEVPPQLEFKSGIAAPPRSIKCSIKLRSDNRGEVIRREFMRMGEELRKFEMEMVEEDTQYNKKQRV